MDQSNLRIALDCCRPSSNDRAASGDLERSEMRPIAECLASDPAARRLFDRIRQFDARISAAMHDVPVPPGLGASILARIQAASAAEIESSQAPIDAATRAQPATVPAAATVPVVAIGADVAPVANLVADTPSSAGVAAATRAKRRTFRRRSWALLAIATCVALAISAAVLWPRHAPLTKDGLVTDSGNWYAQLWDRTNWVALAPRERGLAKYPVPPTVRGTARRWSDVSTLVGADAVAYDLTVGGHRAALFVIPSDEFVAGSTPPMKPDSSTGGLMIGCWQTQGMVYVLVVEGDERNYQNRLDSAAEPSMAESSPAPRFVPPAGSPRTS